MSDTAATDGTARSDGTGSDGTGSDGTGSDGTAATDARTRRARRVRGVLALLAVVVINVGTYAALATDTARRWVASVEAHAYPGAFVVALLTNLTLSVPVPYNPVVLQLMTVV